jgi:hypothetical protein
MKKLLVRDGDIVRFVLTDIEPNLQRSVEAFEFTPSEAGFERRFAATPNVETIFDRFTASIEKMLRQHAGLERTPWQDAVRRFSHAAMGMDWCLVGSAALAVRGIDVTPGDVDIVVASTDFTRVAQVLDDHLVEPPSDNGDGWVARWFCRAFLDARVEFIAGVHDWVDTPSPADFGPVAWTRRESVRWEGIDLFVPPIDLQLAVSKRRELADRVREIEEFIAAG